MSGEVDAEPAAYVEMVRRELPAAIAAQRAEEIAYFGSEEPVHDPGNLQLTVEVDADGLMELIVDCTIHRDERPPPMRARFKLDPEWRRAQDAERPGGYLGHVAWGLVMGGGYETPEQDPSLGERAAADARVPDAGVLWADLVRTMQGRLDGDGHLVVGTTTVTLTSGQWRQHVVEWEVAAGRDRGPDAMRPGQGPGYAAADLDEILASGRPRFVVWWRGEPHPSRRPELPPL